MNGFDPSIFASQYVLGYLILKQNFLTHTRRHNGYFFCICCSPDKEKKFNSTKKTGWLMCVCVC